MEKIGFVLTENERIMKMHNDDRNYAISDSCSNVAAKEIKPMSVITSELRDTARKACAIAHEINANLFGQEPTEGEPCREVNCAYDCLMDLQATLGDTIATLDAVLKRING